jgi:nicotinate-nucleotide adenylyltransferase
MTKKKHIGLFFGTFNPIHVGHLVIANYMAQRTEIDEVWFVVSPHNPLKNKKSILPDYHRYRLITEAIEDNPLLRASNIEFDLPQPSYTIDTLTYLTEKYPIKRFSIIMGEDNLRTFHKWKNHEQIIENFGILVYPRVRTEYDKNASISLEEIQGFMDHPNLTFCREVPVMAISASFIRKQIRDKKNVQYLLTEPVAKYIEEMHFYEK